VEEERKKRKKEKTMKEERNERRDRGERGGKEEMWKREMSRATHSGTYLTSSLLSIPVSRSAIPPVISEFPLTSSSLCLDDMILV